MHPMRYGHDDYERHFCLWCVCLGRAVRSAAWVEDVLAQVVHGVCLSVMRVLACTCSTRVFLIVCIRNLLSFSSQDPGVHSVTKIYKYYKVCVCLIIPL